MKQLDNIEGPLVIERLRRGQTYFSMNRPHSHRSYEIYYLIDGERQYFIQDRTYAIKKGTLVLIKPNIIHKTLTTKIPDHERFLINIEEGYFDHITKNLLNMNWFELFDRDIPIVELTVKDQIWMQDQVYQLELASQGKFAIDKNMTQLLLLELLIRLTKLLSQNHYHEIEEKKQKISHIRTNEMVQYINQNYKQKISLQLLSEVFYVSTYHLSRMFKRETGFNIPEYINQVRVLEAEKLLIKTKFSITEISERVGYENSTSFGRVFKKLKCMSPRSYREQVDIQKIGLS